MMVRAKENSVNISSDLSAYTTAVKASSSCVQNAQTSQTMDACSKFSSIDDLGRTIWSKIQAAGMNRQFSGFDGEIRHMEEVIVSEGQRMNVQPLKEIVLA